MLPDIITAVPGPQSLALARELRRYESRNVTFVSPQFPVFWQRAAGANVWDVDGNRYLDLTSGFGVAGLGYGPASVIQAATAQLQELYHAMGDVHPAVAKVDLCRELSRLTFEQWGAGPGKTILTNSGTEAVEAALKTALVATGRRGVLAFQGAYHGLGYGALTVGGLGEFRDPFVSQLPDWAQLARLDDSVEHLDQLLSAHRIGAILIEPIQGRAGVILPPAGFLRHLRALADAHGALLIFDEIYTGFYRTGPRFACDREGVVPDLICLGKALTSGFPLAACVGRAAVMDRWPESDGEALHTSTFLGNPLGCRMALAALQAMESGHPAMALAQKSQCLETTLRQLGRGPVRGSGFLWGLELPSAEMAGRVVVEGLQRGLILLSGGPGRQVLTLTPPFVITEEEIRWACAQIKALTDQE